MPHTISSSLAIRTGTSETRDPQQAALELFAALNQPDIKLAIFYCASDYDLPALGDAIKAQFGDINVIGCTTAGEITPLGYLEGAITGVSLAAEDLDVVTEMFEVDTFDRQETAQRVNAMLGTLGQRQQAAPSAADSFALLFVDGLSMQEESVVSCIYQQLQGIDLIGGSAADGTRFGATHLYFNGQFQSGVAILTVIRTDLPFLAFRTQHFVPSDKRMVVTKADPARRTVYEINGKPAPQEYARIIGIPSDELGQLVFATYPVMVRVGGQNFIRSIGRINDDGSLQFFCAIDEGIVLTIASGVDLIENLEDAFARVREVVGPPVLVLGCDCLFRRLEMDRDGTRAQAAEVFTRNNVIGFTTYGEQYNAMHVNQTFTGIAIGARA